jgi:hypothetical protein
MPSAPPGNCPVCDYGLRGLPPAHRCPECDVACDEFTRIWRRPHPNRVYLTVAAQTFALGAYVALLLVFRTGWDMVCGAGIAAVALILRISSAFRLRPRRAFLAVAPAGVFIRNDSQPMRHFDHFEWDEVGPFHPDTRSFEFGPNDDPQLNATSPPDVAPFVESYLLDAFLKSDADAAEFAATLAAARARYAPETNDARHTTPFTPHPRCVHCDYDVHGLPAGAACPECGLLLDRSPQLADLGFTSRSVRTLQWAVGLATLGAVTPLAAHVLSLFTSVSLRDALAIADFLRYTLLAIAGLLLVRNAPSRQTTIASICQRVLQALSMILLFFALLAAFFIVMYLLGGADPFWANQFARPLHPAAINSWLVEALLEAAFCWYLSLRLAAAGRARMLPVTALRVLTFAVLLRPLIWLTVAPDAAPRFFATAQLVDPLLSSLALGLALVAALHLPRGLFAPYRHSDGD